MKKKHTPTISNLLKKLAQKTNKKTITLESLMEAFGARAYGPLLFLLSIISLTPIAALPGVPLILAFFIILIAVQYIFGEGAPWIPKRLSEKSFSTQKTQSFLKKLIPTARLIDKMTKPRMTFMNHPWVHGVAMIVIILLAFSYIPFSFIPFGIMIPALIILIFSITILTKDGLLMSLALLGGILTLTFLTMEAL